DRTGRGRTVTACRAHRASTKSDRWQRRVPSDHTGRSARGRDRGWDPRRPGVEVWRMADALAIARENINAYNAADWGRFKSTLSADSTYEELATQRRLGVDDAVEATKDWKRSFHDSTGTITKYLAR